MEEIQWTRLMQVNSVESSSNDLVRRLKHRATLIKYKSNGHTYSRVYYLTLSEDAIHYHGSRNRKKHEACKIKDIDEIRHGFTTVVWKKFLTKKKVTDEKAKLAFSILYNNNRHSLDLLAESEEICQQWIAGLEYLIRRYRSHLRTHHQITDRWLWEAFSRADRDHSGHLNRREVRRLLYELNVELEERQMDEYFNQANIRVNNYDQLKNLDKEEFLIFYKYVSCRPELLQLICQFNGSTPEQSATMLSEYAVIKSLPRISPLEEPNNAAAITFQRSESKKNRTLISGFDKRSKASRKSKQHLTPAAIDKRNFLTVEQLKEFLQTEQQMRTISIEDCSRLIARFEPSVEGRESEEIGVDGLRLLLLHDEFCLMNTANSHRVYHDMTRPITDYFIATSHNTYLRDNQVYGACTPETYIHALRTGCRAVEMDCYDGEHNEPMVYHGNTLTKPIPFREVITAIETQAFAASPYPLFLNIENHCSYEQQGVMARVLRDTFKDRLLSKPFVDDFQKLPSPEELKYQVIVRSRRYPKGKTSADPKSDRSNDETEPNPKDYHPDFSSLIIYSQIVSFSNIQHTISTQKCFHSISFNESKGDDLIDADAPDHLELLQLTRQHLVRVYPGMKRQDSSNIDPILYWTYGVQMVALNYQANDQAMALQHGFFSDNGGCGYLLKPACLFATDGSFDPKSRLHTKGKQLNVRVISAQHLPKEADSKHDSDLADPYVRVFIFGVENDYSEHRTPSVRNNGLNPVWDYKIRAKISCPELCLILFKVRDEDRFSGSTFLGQACLPFNCLQSGYRHIKLKSKNGDFIHGTLFVHVAIEDV